MDWSAAGAEEWTGARVGRHDNGRLSEDSFALGCRGKAPAAGELRAAFSGLEILVDVEGGGEAGLVARSAG